MEDSLSLLVARSESYPGSNSPADTKTHKLWSSSPAVTSQYDYRVTSQSSLGVQSWHDYSLSNDSKTVPRESCASKSFSETHLVAKAPNGLCHGANISSLSESRLYTAPEASHCPNITKAVIKFRGSTVKEVRKLPCSISFFKLQAAPSNPAQAQENSTLDGASRDTSYSSNSADSFNNNDFCLALRPCKDRLGKLDHGFKRPFHSVGHESYRHVDKMKEQYVSRVEIQPPSATVETLVHVELSEQVGHHVISAVPEVNSLTWSDPAKFSIVSETCSPVTLSPSPPLPPGNSTPCTDNVLVEVYTDDDCLSAALVNSGAAAALNSLSCKSAPSLSHDTLDSAKPQAIHNPTKTMGRADRTAIYERTRQFANYPIIEELPDCSGDEEVTWPTFAEAKELVTSPSSSSVSSGVVKQLVRCGVGGSLRRPSLRVTTLENLSGLGSGQLLRPSSLLNWSRNSFMRRFPRTSSITPSLRRLQLHIREVSAHSPP